MDEVAWKHKVIGDIVRHLDGVDMENNQVVIKLREIAMEAWNHAKNDESPSQLCGSLMNLSVKLKELANNIEKESK